jgi:hypothetical protein
MLLLMVLAQCGAGQPVSPDKLDEALTRQGEVLIEGVMTYHSVCPKCPPKSQCKPCEAPFAMIDPNKLKVRLSKEPHDILDGSRVRARVRRQGKELVASCLAEVKP